MIKKITAVLLACVLACSFVWAEEKVYEEKLYTLDRSVDSFNIEDYTVLESEKEEMHNAEQILRRNYEGGVAWIVFEVPYITEFKAECLHYPQDIENMSYEVSKDGTDWTEVEVTQEIFEEEGKWTKYEYTAENIQNARYIKVVWGEEAETNHWWTPYFVGLFVNSGEPISTRIIFEGDSQLQIPAYDSKKYKIDAKLIDQIGMEVEEEITLTLIASDDERIVLDENNEIEIFSDMTEGTEFTIRAEGSEFSQEQTFVLIPCLHGDTDGDDKLTEADASAIIENYGKTADLDNRLCDIDKNGKIDIIDLAFVLRYKEV